MTVNHSEIFFDMLCRKDGPCCGNDTFTRGIGGSVVTTRKLSEHARGGSMTRRSSVWLCDSRAVAVLREPANPTLSRSAPSTKAAGTFNPAGPRRGNAFSEGWKRYDSAKAS
jgi:hypothetical protein